MEIVVVGGGCYGCLHTRQLLKAAQHGRIAVARLILVDRNPVCRALDEFRDEPLVQVVRAEWSAYLRGRLARTSADTPDQLVPAPFAPHIAFNWLSAAISDANPRASVSRDRCELQLGLPYEHADETGNLFISAAAWTCPMMCIEPALCPATRGPRTWELGDIARQAADRTQQYTSTTIFTTRHFAWGVGTIPLAQLARARDDTLARLRSGQTERILVGTVSSCHGVLGAMRVELSD